MSYRIDGFKQIEAFYEWVFNNPDKARPTHISLYLFLWNQGNRAKWIEWFKCPYDLAMQGACIGNNRTYYKCLDELQKYGIIKYKKGVNNFKAPLINLICLYDSEHVTEHVTVPQCAQQHAQQTAYIYNYITNNEKLIIDNEKSIIDFLESLKEKPKEFNFKKELIKLGIEEKIASDWLKVRKKKKATNTETAFNLVKSQIEKTKLSANECIKMAVGKSWAGFNADWIPEKRKPGLVM